MPNVWNIMDIENISSLQITTTSDIKSSLHQLSKSTRQILDQVVPAHDKTETVLPLQLPVVAAEKEIKNQRHVKDSAVRVRGSLIVFQNMQITTDFVFSK